MQLPQLRRPKLEAINLIGEQIKRGRQIDLGHLEYAQAVRRYRQWDKETRRLIRNLFDIDRYAKEFTAIAEGIVIDKNTQSTQWRSQYIQRMNAKVGLLKEFKVRIEKHLIPPSDIPTDFWSLIHPEIIKVTKTRFESSHYADCAEAAFKHINSVVKQLVKTAIGKELDGASLMKTAFSVNSPVIEIDAITTETGRNIQQGYMEIFAGSMTGIRNPKAHQNITIGKERAIHFVFLASLLMDTIDIALDRYRY